MEFNFNTFPTLKTERLSLEEATLKDDTEILALRSSEEINKFVGTKRMQNLQEAVNFIDTCKDLYTKENRIFWLIKHQQEIIGSIVLHHISLKNKYAEIGYKLKPKFQQKGFMSEALKTVLSFGFTKMNLKTIEAFTHKNNLASIALLEKHNFVFQEDRKCSTYDFNQIFKLENN